MTLPFISSDDLATALATETIDSDIATIALDSACETVRAAIDNVVNLTEEEVALDGNGGYRLLLPYPPVREIISVTEDEIELNYEGTDCVLDRAGLLRRVGATWSVGRGNVVVAYVHGWDVTEGAGDPGYDPTFIRVPSSIRSVALALAGRLYQRFAAGSTSVGAITSERLGDYAYTTDSSSAISVSSSLLTSEEIASLEPYRDRRFG